MSMATDNKYVVISLCAHVTLLLVFLITLQFSTPLPVIENTNQHDVISAVVLGDTAKSKILPQKIMPQPEPPPIKQPVKVAEQPVVTPPPPKVAVKTPPPQPVPKQEVIALKKADKKPVIDKKKIQDMFAEDLLKDMKKQTEKHKNADALLADIKKQKQKVQKDFTSQFEKTLKVQAEKSLRQQLLDDEIKIVGERTRQSQGIVDKYKALIIQAISEHWIIPTQANKKLYSELMIRLAPGGMVLDVQITKTSGDPSLDSSARSAVLKSSPLPVPKDPQEFESFRQFVLKVKPENIL